MSTSFESAVDAIRRQYPQSDGLCTALAAAGYRPSRDFLTAYVSARLTPAAKARLITVALGETQPPSRYQNRLPLDADRYERVLEFFCNHPREPLVGLTPKPITRDLLPKGITAFCGVGRLEPMAVLRRLVIDPYVELVAGGRSSVQLPLELTEELESRLRQAGERFLLDEEGASRLLAKGVTAWQVGFYFGSTHPVLRLRNALCFAVTCLKADSDGGRLQNRIPVEVSKALGVARLSLPELRVAADLAGLVLNGALPAKALESYTGKRRAFVSMLRQLGDDRAWLTSPTPIAAQLAELHLLGERDMERICAGARRQGVFLNSFFFNTHRMVTQPNEMTDLHDFGPFYAMVDATSLRESILEVRPDLGPVVATVSVHEARFPGIRQRDLLNVLLFARNQSRVGREVTDRLPLVARYTLGEPEQAWNKGTGKQTGKRKERGESAPRPLPQLDRLLAEVGQPFGYLLHPGYKEVLPKDAPIFVPRAVARMYAGLPEGVREVGPDRVPWGKSPYAEEFMSELQDWKIKPLGG